MSFKGILRGVIITLVISSVALLGAAAAKWFGVASERAASIAVFVCVVIGAFAGAFAAARIAGQKKLFNALAVSLVFMAILTVTALAVGASAELNIIKAVLFGSIFAAGIIAALIA
ncbi:MAG: TIGR04086 family membrane protein [Clostridia bacterium]|nr:TIGR04086 family membrane protein [Clostridia bacterium]MBR0277095.1 TIGR04086 family membrane protein [Clostridia bacterium]